MSDYLIVSSNVNLLSTLGVTCVPSLTNNVEVSLKYVICFVFFPDVLFALLTTESSKGPTSSAPTPPSTSNSVLFIDPSLILSLLQRSPYFAHLPSLRGDLLQETGQRRLRRLPQRDHLVGRADRLPGARLLQRDAARLPLPLLHHGRDWKRRLGGRALL